MSGGFNQEQPSNGTVEIVPGSVPSYSSNTSLSTSPANPRQKEQDFVEDDDDGYGSQTTTKTLSSSDSTASNLVEPNVLTSHSVPACFSLQDWKVSKRSSLQPDSAGTRSQQHRGHHGSPSSSPSPIPVTASRPSPRHSPSIPLRPGSGSGDASSVASMLLSSHEAPSDTLLALHEEEEKVPRTQSTVGEEEKLITDAVTAVGTMSAGFDREQPSSGTVQLVPAGSLPGCSSNTNTSSSPANPRKEDQDSGIFANSPTKPQSSSDSAAVENNGQIPRNVLTCPSLLACKVSERSPPQPNSAGPCSQQHRGYLGSPSSAPSPPFSMPVTSPQSHFSPLRSPSFPPCPSGSGDASSDGSMLLSSHGVPSDTLLALHEEEEKMPGTRSTVDKEEKLVESDRPLSTDEQQPCDLPMPLQQHLSRPSTPRHPIAHQPWFVAAVLAPPPSSEPVPWVKESGEGGGGVSAQLVPGVGLALPRDTLFAFCPHTSDNFRVRHMESRGLSTNQVVGGVTFQPGSAHLPALHYPQQQQQQRDGNLISSDLDHRDQFQLSWDRLHPQPSLSSTPSTARAPPPPRPAAARAPAADRQPGRIVRTRDPSLFPAGSLLPLPSESALTNSIGQGGNGTVTYIYHRGREFAVKKTHFRTGEVDILCGLQHKNIINLIAVMMGEEDPVRRARYLCYHFYPRLSGDLQGYLSRLGRGGLSSELMSRRESQDQLRRIVANTKHLLAGVLRGLAHLHRQGIVHNDIKPSNILLQLPGQCPCPSPFLCACPEELGVVITDFDSAMSVEKLRQTPSLARLLHRSHAIGTPGYRSIEYVLAGTRTTEELTTAVVTAADIWALGCSVLKMFIAHTGPHSQREMAFLRLWSCSGQAQWRVERQRAREMLGVAVLERVFPQWEQLVQLVDDCMQVDPLRRARAEDLLDHPFFSS